MAVFETWLKSDLKKPVTVKQLPGVVFSQDSKANKVGVIVTDGGKPVTLSGTVYGYVIKPNGTTVEVAGAIDSEDASRASFVMPQEAYAVGHISIVIKLSSTGSVVTTLAACTAYVYQSRKGTGVVPTGTVIPDLQYLEEVIAEAEAATAAAETAAESVAAVIAADYSDLTFPVKAGTLCYYEDALFKANQAIATSEEWTAAHWTQTTIEAEIDNIKLKLERNDVTYSSGNTSGYYKIENDEITRKQSSSYTCQKIEVSDWMKGTVDYQIVSLEGIKEAAVFVAFADEDDEYISKPANAVGSFRTPIPSNAKYIYLSFYGATWCAGYTIPANKIIMTKDMEDLYLMNLYKGMNGVAFGTSLTYRAQTTGGFLQYLPDMSGITFDNQGIGSATILGDGGNLDMLAAIKAYSSYSGKSVCLLEGFVNDWYQNKTLGTWKDTAETTVCGCVRSAINYMLSQNANLTVFLILDPYGRNYGGSNCSSQAENSANLTQFEYYEEIAKVAESLGIPVIREYAESQISENTPQYLLDNIHPNAMGAEQSARIIWMKMKQYLPNL